MITAISSVDQNSSKSNLIGQIRNDFSARKSHNYNQIPVAFNGNLAKVGRNLFGEEIEKFGAKVKRFTSEANESIGGAFRNLKGKDELPITEKPLISPVDHDEATLTLFNMLKKYDVDISSVGNISRHPSGGLGSLDKSLIKDKINDALADGDITKEVAEKLKNQVSMCGNFDINSISVDDFTSRISDYGEHALGGLRNAVGNSIDLLQDGLEHLLNNIPDIFT